MNVPLVITVVCSVASWVGVAVAVVMRRKTQAIADRIESATRIAVWAYTHRLVIDDIGGGITFDCLMTDLMDYTTFQPKRGVRILPTRNQYGLYDCPRCTDAVVDLEKHMVWVCRG